MKRTNKQIWFLLLLVVMVSGCKKLLETKPDSKLAVPATAEDLQAMLDTYYKMSEQESALGENSADNYYLTDELWTGLPSEDERNLYIWDKNVLFENPGNDWYNLYEKVNYANAVIEAYPKLSQEQRRLAHDVLGQALVYRASAFLNALTIWAKAYDPASADLDQGIPLRLNTNFNEKSVRASIRQGYDRVVLDLKTAIPLLNVNPLSPIRPSRAAAYGYLSRTGLFMGDFEMAAKYADSCLEFKNVLMDYNELDLTAELPFGRFNEEVIYELASGSTSSIYFGNIDTLLYAAYESTDLRKVAYFVNTEDGYHKYKGSYEGHPSMLFFGLATDELYLNRAEANARLGKQQAALEDLNYLMRHRVKREHFVVYSTDSQTELIANIMQERRKELIFRGLRWADVKRLNVLGAEIGLSRKLGEKNYALRPGDSGFALPIPKQVIQLTGMQQN